MSDEDFNLTIKTQWLEFIKNKQIIFDKNGEDCIPYAFAIYSELVNRMMNQENPAIHTAESRKKFAEDVDYIVDNNLTEEFESLCFLVMGNDRGFIANYASNADRKEWYKTIQDFVGEHKNK